MYISMDTPYSAALNVSNLAYLQNHLGVWDLFYQYPWYKDFKFPQNQYQYIS